MLHRSINECAHDPADDAKYIESDHDDGEYPNIFPERFLVFERALDGILPGSRDTRNRTTIAQ